MSTAESTNAFVHVVATLKAKEGSQAALQQAFSKLVPASQAEVGCVQYLLHTDVADATTFVLYEVWASKADFDAHFELSHSVEFGAAAKDLLAEPPAIRFLNRV
ncbi:putative quinol monooxygenase [Pseudomonas shirazensis]|uniref:putative quinol monooxygenase n=1 Tax=Pseudomonas shirazensis TaxID=2745494 RepID=UPI003986E48C